MLYVICLATSYSSIDIEEQNNRFPSVFFKMALAHKLFCRSMLFFISDFTQKKIILTRDFCQAIVEEDEALGNRLLSHRNLYSNC